MNTTKEWLLEFLLTRLLTKQSLGKPLYSYEVTLDEYQSLSRVVKADATSIFHPIRGVDWAACFCLFVSERYRREYDASEGGWSWQGYEKFIDKNLTPPQRSQIVSKGLKYWQRPIRKRSSGLDFLGSLFFEGGLPWPLLRSETHGFGRAIKSGIRNYNKAGQTGKSLIDIIKDHQQYFPKVFQTSETYILLSTIVESLMSLAKQFDLKIHSDPASYLDKRQPDWRSLFPLPIGELNGRALVNEWLKNAGAKEKELQEEREKARSFTSTHSLKGLLSNWYIESTVYLPRQYQITCATPIHSTRLEMVFFEGDVSLFTAGILYGKLDEARTQISVEFPKTEYVLKRKSPDKPLTLQLFSNGLRVYSDYFQESDIDIHESPLVFEDDEAHKLISNASASTSQTSVLVRCPTGAGVKPYIEHQEEDQSHGRWYRFTSNAIIEHKNNSFSIRFNENINDKITFLSGRLSLYDTIPHLSYYGVPRVGTTHDDKEPEQQQVVTFLNAKSSLEKPVCGKYILNIKSQQGISLYRKTIGVLPDDLHITTLCAVTNTPASIHLHTRHSLSVSVKNETIQNNVTVQDGYIQVQFTPKIGSEIPSSVILEMKSHLADDIPVTVRLPYPYQGARIFDPDGVIVNKNIIALDELLGMSMQLTGSTHYKQDFFMVTELLGPTKSTLRRNYQFSVSQQSISISLHSFYDDFMQMFSTIPDQDSTIRVRIETDQIIHQFEITRYSGKVDELSSSDHFEVVTETPIVTEKAIYPIGIHLSDPGQNAITIPERLSAGISTGTFEIPNIMKSKGPWLIAPSADSDIRFRPKIWVTADMEDPVPDSSSPHETLHSAASFFHPYKNPHVFDDVISVMATDLSHSGWDYLAKLKEKYSYLPLSAFMSWRALSQNTQALSVAILRLNANQQFCNQLVNDLAVIWEEVTVREWHKAVKANREYLAILGVPEMAIEPLISNILKVIENTIPAVKYLSDYILAGQVDKIKPVPISIVFPGWYQDLRRRHSDDNHWPELLGEELYNWLSKQKYTDDYTSVINMSFERGVVFLPVFMAYLSVGKIEYLSIEEVNLIALDSNITDIRFAVRVLSDFDREAWYEPVYAMVLSWLVANEEYE